MILVTGAAGKTGHTIIRALKNAQSEIRALVFRNEYTAEVASLGVESLVVGDMSDPFVYRDAARGVSAVYHICPNVSPQEVEIGLIGIQAAQEAGVDHLVYHSVLHPQIEAMPHHWQKLRVEEALINSRLNYTILQPGIYMQNILSGWKTIQRDGILSVPYSVDAPLAMIDLEDVALVAATVLSDPAHYAATYQLVSEVALTPAAMAVILTAALDRPVGAKQITIDEWSDSARSLSPYQMQALIAMFKCYDAAGLHGNPNVLNWLLGRPATTFEHFVQRILRTQ
jgi:NAD(P)H dehydrogenase (quinone)